tara:strand:+ start:94 stop:300 length:207 start_codon:yes stop_codon:yes gene_type:complete
LTFDERNQRFFVILQQCSESLWYLSQLLDEQVSTYDHSKHLVKSAGLAQEGIRLHLGASIIAGQSSVQ